MPVDFETLSRSRLKIMLRAGEQVSTALRALAQAGVNPVAQVLGHHGKFVETDYSPRCDLYDDQTGSQYHYHASAWLFCFRL